MTKLSRGTPQTLKRAIENGLEDFQHDGSTKSERLVELLKLHVADFIRNNLGPLALKNNDPEIETIINKFVAKL